MVADPFLFLSYINSRKKKLRAERQCRVDNAGPAEQIENCQQDGVHAAKESTHKQKKVPEIKKKNESDIAEQGDGSIVASPNMKRYI